jgi:hypothetical protein
LLVVEVVVGLFVAITMGEMVVVYLEKRDLVNKMVLPMVVPVVHNQLVVLVVLVQIMNVIGFGGVMVVLVRKGRVETVSM